MKIKRRVSLKASTWNRRDKQPTLAVETEPEPAANDDQRHDQNAWHFLGSVGNPLAWDHDQQETQKETEREAAPAPVESKKKGRKIRPMFSALRQKLRRKPKPLLHLNEETSDAQALKRGAEKNPRQPLLTYDQWERFMDTVAFPEKSKPFLALKDYITTTTEKTREVLHGSDCEHNSNDDTMSLAEYLSTQSVDEESVEKMKFSGITWEEFMDTIAFPENILSRKYNNLLTFIAQNRVETKNDRAISSTFSHSPRGSLTKDDKYAFDNEEQDDVKLYSMVKDFAEEDLGITLTALDGQKGIFISHVASGSKGAASGLRAGMHIISINQHSCPEDTEEAQFMLDSVEREVNIFAQPGETPGYMVQGLDVIEMGKAALANLYNQKVILPGFVLENDDDNSEDESSEGESLEEPDWAEPKGVAAMRKEWQDRAIALQNKKITKTSSMKTYTVYKESPSEVIGIAFVQTSDWPGIFVNQVMPASKFYGTGLKKGMQIISINGQPCPKKIDPLIKKIQKVTGKLELCVEMSVDAANTMDHNSFITATIVKSGDVDPGLELRRDRLRGGIFIKSIDPYSGFVETNLRPGLRIMSINGHACPKDVRDCMYELQQADGILDIIAENVPEKSLRLE